MAERDLFYDDWIECLREQYMTVIRTRDAVTERTLTGVLRRVGFSESELADLCIRATMHIEDVGPDYVPDMNILETVPKFKPHPAECTCPECIPVDESIHDEDGQLHNEMPESEGEAGRVFPVAQPEDETSREDDMPKQLSLFE